MGVTVCAPIAVMNSMKATRLDPNERDGATLSKSTVLQGSGSRDPIPVQREMANGSMEVVGTTEVIKVAEAATPSFVTTPERVYADSALIAAATDSAVSVATPEPLAAPVAPTKPVPGLTKVTPASAAVAVNAPKVRVSLSNRTMGKHRITVRSIAISESLVVLAYPKDSDNIIEPPLCGNDSPIRVDYGGESYHCLFGGWTAELEGMFLVVMIRTDPPQA